MFFKKKQKKHDIHIMNHFIIHSEDSLPQIARDIQKMLNKYCDAVVAINRQIPSPYLRLVTGKAVYSQEKNTVEIVINGGAKIVHWMGEVNKFLILPPEQTDIMRK